MFDSSPLQAHLLQGRAALLILLTVAATCASFAVLGTTASEPAKAESLRCMVLRALANRKLRQLNELERRTGARRIRREMTQLEHAIGDLLQYQQSVLTSRPSAGRTRELAQIASQLAENETHLRSVRRSWINVFLDTDSARVDYYEAVQRLRDAGCDEPPPECGDPDEAGTGEIPATRPSRAASRATLDAESLVGQLARPITGRPPVLGRVGPDGTVTDFFDGSPIPNPANPGAPVRVELGGQSPFHSGLVLTVNFNTVTIGDTSATLAQFTGPDGRPISYGPDTHYAPVREIPSVRDVFPNGFVVLPTVPAGVAVPVLRSSGSAVGGRLLDAFRALQRIYEATALTPNLVSSLATPPPGESPCGYSARFAFLGLEYVATTCGRTPTSEPWTVRVSAVDEGTSKGMSLKFNATLTRDGAWHAISQAKVWIHPFDAAEAARLTPEALRLWRETNANAPEAAEAKVNRLELRLLPDSDDDGFGDVQLRKPGAATGSRGTRWPIRANCSQTAPPGYTERNIP